ncbi:MAG: hypothetical protein ACP5IC_01815 [Minisyncoccia bacterium]
MSDQNNIPEIGSGKTAFLKTWWFWTIVVLVVLVIVVKLVGVNSSVDTTNTDNNGVLQQNTEAVPGPINPSTSSDNVIGTSSATTSNVNQ